MSGPNPPPSVDISTPETAADGSPEQAGSSPEDTDLFPLVVLIDELKSDDVRLRLHSITSLLTIAHGLGEQRTREELIPFLQDYETDEEDEVLLRLAQVLGLMGPKVGGSHHLHVLLPILIQLAMHEEHTIRQQANESILRLVADIPPDRLNAHFFPMLEQLSTHEYFPAQISLCHLLPCAYTVLPRSRDRLLALAVQLAQARLPRVRHALCECLGELCTSVHQANVAGSTDAGTHAGQLLTVFSGQLLVDKQDSVRVFCPLALPALIRLTFSPGQATQFEGMLIALSKDAMWRVRCVLAQQLPEIADAYISKQPGAARPGALLAASFVPQFTTVIRALLTDCEAATRRAAVATLCIMAKRFDPGVTETQVLPLLEARTTDQDEQVRAELGATLCHLAGIVGRDTGQTVVIPYILRLLTAESTQVRLNIIQNLHSVVIVCGLDTLSTRFLDALSALCTDADWRVRYRAILQLPTIAQMVGLEFFSENILQLLISWLNDRCYSIRNMTGEIIAELVKEFGSEWACANLLPRLLKQIEADRYLIRSSAIDIIGRLIKPASAEQCARLAFPRLLERLRSDPVPNVRFAAAHAIAACAPHIDIQDLTTNAQPLLEEVVRISRLPTGDQDLFDAASEALATVSGLVRT